MEQPDRIREQVMAGALTEAKDELNLAEFPLCVLGHRPRADQRTLRFQDRIWDRKVGEHVIRQLTVTGSDAYGLPTALDDEVLLGLVQLSRQHGFAARKVPFTRYQLIRLLGWRDESKSYERVETSLNRWTGVTLFYANAWWHKLRQCWVDEKFHVLDNVRLQRARDRGRGDAGREDERPLSYFVWNEVLFDSFRAGNLKSLDFEFFRSLKHPTAKRLYRFLDKRFYRRRRWEFGLKELAWEHIGLARSYDAAGLKRRLQPGIEELEAKGFLHEVSCRQRYQRVCSGEWRVTFERPDSRRTSEFAAVQAACDGSVEETLRVRGVGARVARRIAADYPPEQVAGQIEVFDSLLANRDSRVSRNPPGFLIRAIEEDYPPPEGFVSRAEKERQAEVSAERRQALAKRQRKRADQRVQQEEAEATAIRAFWAAFPLEERTWRENEALTQATQLQRSLLAGGGRAAGVTRQLLLANYARRKMQDPKPSCP
ncbi:MAG: replication initiator protein A [Verrucomicrobiales bacterium]|nr:replication initiator protein A [Verrucomicrobiales bacterium]